MSATMAYFRKWPSLLSLPEKLRKGESHQSNAKPRLVWKHLWV